MTLGEKLRIIRSESGMTIDDLSHLSEVSKSLLSQIERNLSVPTVTTLERITNALGISVTELFSQLEKENNQGQGLFQLHKSALESSEKGPARYRGRIDVVRKDERKKLVLPRDEAHYELLSPDFQRKIEFITVHFPVGAKLTDLLSHKGEECGIILKGKLRGFIGSQEIVLEEGDSIYFDSTIPHRWENAGETEMKAIWAITPPSL